MAFYIKQRKSGIISGANTLNFTIVGQKYRNDCKTFNHISYILYILRFFPEHLKIFGNVVLYIGL